MNDEEIEIEDISKERGSPYFVVKFVRRGDPITYWNTRELAEAFVEGWNRRLNWERGDN